MKTKDVHSTYDISETALRLREQRFLNKLSQGEAASMLGIRSKSLEIQDPGHQVSVGLADAGPRVAQGDAGIQHGVQHKVAELDLFVSFM